MFSTDEYEAKMTGAFEHFGEELRKIRTGRASVDRKSVV